MDRKFVTIKTPNGEFTYTKFEYDLAWWVVFIIGVLTGLIF